MRNSRPPSYFGRLSGISAVQESLDELRRAVSDSISRSEEDRALLRKTSEDVARLSQDVLALQNATAKSLEAAVSGVQASSQSASNYVAELTRHLADLKIQGTAADRMDAIGASIGDLLQILLHDITTQGPVALLEAERRLAIDSDDHRFPRGTRNDNTRYPRFRWKCEQVCGRKLSLLDIGCAGGGIVLEFLLAGHFALGLEGSDYSMRTQRACWRLIPNHLMTCDVTRPFCLHNASNQPILFDVISAWEVLEHIREADLPQFFKNIRSHLAPGGFFVASIATFEDRDPVSGAVWHVTVRDREWWQCQFARAGLEPVQDLFETLDFPRGSGNGPNDWSVLANPEYGFHAVLRDSDSDSRPLHV